jgi:hypothetical protein
LERDLLSLQIALQALNPIHFYNVLCIRTAFLTKLKFTGTKIKATKHFTQKNRPHIHKEMRGRQGLLVKSLRLKAPA